MVDWGRSLISSTREGGSLVYVVLVFSRYSSPSSSKWVPPLRDGVVVSNVGDIIAPALERLLTSKDLDHCPGLKEALVVLQRDGLGSIVVLPDQEAPCRCTGSTSCVE